MAVNTFGADGLVSRHTSAGSTFYTFDERGNVSQRLSSTSAVMGSDLYDGYGARTGTAAQTDPWGSEAQYGYYSDTETGLILCTHRFYDPGTGRFVTRDPSGYGGGINLYGYVGNNSVNEDDPSGYGGFGGAPRPIPPQPPCPPITQTPATCQAQLTVDLAQAQQKWQSTQTNIQVTLAGGIAFCSHWGKDPKSKALCVAAVAFFAWCQKIDGDNQFIADKNAATARYQACMYNVQSSSGH